MTEDLDTFFAYKRFLSERAQKWSNSLNALWKKREMPKRKSKSKRKSKLTPEQLKRKRMRKEIRDLWGY